VPFVPKVVDKKCLFSLFYSIIGQKIPNLKFLLIRIKCLTKFFKGDINFIGCAKTQKECYRMKKEKYLELWIISLLLVVSIFFSSCASFYADLYRPDLSVAEIPRGLDIDSENIAYLGGPIRSINGFGLAANGPSSKNPGRTIIVPSGETINAIVEFSTTPVNGIYYYGTKQVSLPPLERGHLYVLFLGDPTSMNNWKDKNIRFKMLNPNSGKYEDVKGATFVNP
jgi:hypothetical protein